MWTYLEKMFILVTTNLDDSKRSHIYKITASLGSKNYYQFITIPRKTDHDLLIIHISHILTYLINQIIQLEIK